MSESDIDELVTVTKGYSGADLRNFWSEAALIPIRQIADIASIEAHKIRPLIIGDFKEALDNVKATVNQSDLKKFIDWNS